MYMLPIPWSMEREMLMLMLLALMTPTITSPPTPIGPPGLDTTDTLTFTERGRLRSPSTWSPDTPTSDMAWLPLFLPSLPTLTVPWYLLSPRMWWMPVLSIWPPMLRHKLVGDSLIVKTGRRDY